MGRNEEAIRAYIKNQETADQQLDQLPLKLSQYPHRVRSLVPKSFLTVYGGFHVKPQSMLAVIDLPSQGCEHGREPHF